MDSLLTHEADDQGLAVAGRHHLDPVGLFSSPLSLEVGQAPDVVYLHVHPRATQLACVRQEPFQQFRPLVPVHRWLVVEDCVFLPSQGNAAPLRYQTRQVSLDPCWARGTTIFRQLAGISIAHLGHAGVRLPNGTGGGLPFLRAPK